jgi:hypothetical protein
MYVFLLFIQDKHRERVVNFDTSEKKNEVLMMKQFGNEWATPKIILHSMACLTLPL